MTLTSIVMLCLLFTAADQLSLRIANGENRNVSTPFFVQVVTNGWVDYGGVGTAYRTICGGTVFEPNFIVTHALCVKEASFVSVLTGPFHKKRFGKETREIIVPKENVFVSTSSEEGIAIIQIPQAVPADQVLSPCHQTQLPMGAPLAVVGMGSPSEHSTRMASQLQFMRAQEYKKGCSGTDTICTVGTDGGSVCMFDSGSPLMLLNSTGHPLCLYGVVSHSIEYNCQSPDVSARLGVFSNFIQNITGIESK